MLDRLTLESFRPYLNQKFQVQIDPAPSLDLILAECEAIKPSAAGPDRDPFRLLFIGNTTPILPQRIYRLVHEQMGTVDIFIVPLGPDERGMRYEAIFT
jgi:hypothetical protein